MWKPEHRLTAERRNLRCGSGCRCKAITADDGQVKQKIHPPKLGAAGVVR